MRTEVATIAVLLLLTLAFFVIMAPFAFVMQGQDVYIWPDDRITALTVLSIVVVLLLAATSNHGRYLRPTAASCTAFAGSVFVLFVVFNFGTNDPDGVFPALFSTQAAMTAEGILDSMRFSPVYGLPAQAMAWFCATVVSFLALRLSGGWRVAAVDTAQFASLVLLLYTLGVRLIIPQWAAREITGLQYGTFLGWFSNDDLLLCAVAGSVSLFALRWTMREGRQILPAA